MPPGAQYQAGCLAVVRIAGVLALTLLALAARPAPKQSTALPKERYLSPIEMAFSPNGRLLYVVCQDSDELRVLDLTTEKVTKSIRVGHSPRGIAISKDGQRLYVTNASSDTVSVIDTTTLDVVQNLPTGFEPHGVVIDRQQTTLYVANRLSSDVSVIDLQSGKEIKRLLAGRGASYLSLSPDGKSVLCTHVYPNPAAIRTRAEVRDYYHRYRRKKSGRPPSAPQRCRSISCCDVGGRHPRLCRATPP